MGEQRMKNSTGKVIKEGNLECGGNECTREATPLCDMPTTRYEAAASHDPCKTGAASFSVVISLTQGVAASHAPCHRTLRTFGGAPNHWKFSKSLFRPTRTSMVGICEPCGMFLSAESMTKDHHAPPTNGRATNEELNTRRSVHPGIAERLFGSIFGHAQNPIFRPDY